MVSLLAFRVSVSEFSEGPEGESRDSRGARLGKLERVTRVISTITLGKELSLISLSRETNICKILAHLRIAWGVELSLISE